MKVNILTESPHINSFVRDDLSSELYKDIEFYENSDLNIVWDVVIVYERIPMSKTVKVREGGLWFISGEPPMSREYPCAFLKQFDIQITSHKYKNLKNVINEQQSLDWWFAKSFKTKKHRYNLQELKTMTVPFKAKPISMICSKASMLPGHNKRRLVLKKLKEEFSDEIDFYGGDDGNVEYKCDAIMPYQFSICIENSNVNDYWSEKLSDVILGFTIPIYWGCTNIDRYFNTDGMYTFNINDYSSLRAVIMNILKNPEKEYKEKFEILKANREALISNYHMFPHVKNILNSVQLGTDRMVTIRLVDDFFTYRIIFWKIRIIRFLYKLYFKLRIN